MWSGPRNISTAMMRAWENRDDCAVVDEPFYACYLAATGLEHPGRDTVLASQPQDWREVVARLTGPIPGGRRLFYQKQMTHHLLPFIGRDWFGAMVHVFLVRDPALVLQSYLKRRQTVTAEDLGMAAQWEIFQDVRRRTGETPAVIDAEDFLRAPEAHLRALCERLGIAFSSRMLAWPAGPRPTDGAWAPWWYADVQRSTGFAQRLREPQTVPPGHRRIVDQGRECWHALREFRLAL